MRNLYLLTRDLHLYAGLAISPLVLVFAASVFVLNHPRTGPEPPPLPAPGAIVRVPPGIEKLEGMARANAAHQILSQLGINGETNWIGYDGKRGILTIPVARPGRDATVQVSLADGRATVELSRWRMTGAVAWLHKMPGPHLVAMRGNWLTTRVWRWMADALVYLLLFVTASGIYMWAVLRAERRTGLVLVALGAFSFAGVIYALL